MRFFAQLSLFLSAALSLSAVVANPHSNDKFRRHTKRHGLDISLRARGDVGHLQKRFSNARFTFFADGLGACGITNSPSDFIVALNSEQYGNGEYCFQMITITYNGITNQAQITDECPGCPYGGLDFSQGLFQAFADISQGVLYGTWTFDDGAPASSSSSPPPPPPTSTWQPPPSTSSPPSSSPLLPRAPRRRLHPRRHGALAPPPPLLPPRLGAAVPVAALAAALRLGLAPRRYLPAPRLRLAPPARLQVLKFKLNLALVYLGIFIGDASVASQ
ncbi:hypothetical protein SERLA73DRAFT_76576 [Serpula lacrymans var. lacrymans S7.3]|uniref:Uncharacterized protein n=1 Tax=Serpula lacrymans var. lacrymans (strain S7.3) TaxID=936435 RepID=F8Q7D8_SERL3|nr:hypothetical protein SERLA73DRAFT_76576 [Serpula lacrymans var. lacrymans S7.3]